jgi:uncharacterized protein
MRRAERECADPAALERILEASRVLFLALQDEPAPYVLPVCFGFEDGVIYIHSASRGTKIDLIARHPEVGFSASTEMTVVPATSPCAWSSRAESVVGTGRAEILTEETARRHGLDVIMRHYAGHGTPWHSGGAASSAYQAASLARTCVIAVRVGAICGKRIG